MSIEILGLDHFVLTAGDLNITCKFYEQLGFQYKKFAEGRVALHFGSQKINVHQYGQEHEPKAQLPTPGSQDLCFIVNTPINEVIKTLESLGVMVVEGPVERTGARYKLLSVYFRDPDGNLIEFSNIQT